MKVDHARLGLFEDAEETPRGVNQVQTNVCLHGETVFPHPLAERAQGGDSVNARIVPLLPLQMAHLRDKRLGAAHFHAVHHVSNLHAACLGLR